MSEAIEIVELIEGALKHIQATRAAMNEAKPKPSDFRLGYFAGLAAALEELLMDIRQSAALATPNQGLPQDDTRNECCILSPEQHALAPGICHVVSCVDDAPTPPPDDTIREGDVHYAKDFLG